MSNDHQPPGTIKTYIIETDHIHTRRVLEIQHDFVPVLWAVKSGHMFQSPRYNIATDKDGQQVLAAVQPKATRGVRVMLGPNPDALPKGAWADVLPEGMTASQYAFMFEERQFWWRRTHDKAYGASSMSGNDFKLVDGGDKVLAVYINDHGLLHMEKIGKINYFVELGRDLELFSLAAVLGIQDSIRRRRRNAH